ncbi:hypothetical protein SRHO_G00176390 [Serrasalmus rhombeus]
MKPLAVLATCNRKVEVLDLLSPEQKAELILDPNTGALENETLVKEVMMGIISSSEEEQLYVFFEMFVSITKQEQINFIENAGVRDAILNMTLTALAPNFDTFQPSQYELWFQENLFVVLASFQPIWLLVIPENLSCDSYKAILKGMDMSLAVLPVDLEQELRSSREMLSQTLPKGCTAPVPVGVCKKTVVDEAHICQSAGSHPVHTQVSFGNVSAQLCNFSISDLTCSSVAALSSSDLVEVLACNLDSSMNYSRAIWNLFFKKFAAPLDEALSAYSNMSLTISLRDPDVLDAIAEVKVNMFSDAQLTDAVFITEWFQERLRPFLSSVSADFLSCLSSKNFSCQTYQVVVEALSRQDQLMEEEQKRSIVTYFIYPFLSRDDLSDPSCVSSTSGSSDWLAKNFGKFSAYASLEELLILNIHFSSVEVLDSLSPEQKAELILDPNTGALENETLVKEVMMGIISSSEEEQLYVFFEMFVSITKQEQINFIENAGVRDAILNMTLTALAPNFDTFQPSQYELWFQENLFVVLASFQPIWLLVIPGNLSCDSYKAILKGMDMSLAVLPVDLEQELRSSREMLSQTLPKGCTAPVPVGVVAALSSSDLVEVLACNLDSSMNYSRAIWNLFFKKFAAPLDEALSAYSNMSLTISLRDPDVLDAIAEVKVNMFSDAQLTDAVFITEWFQERLRPFLSSVSADFLSCLSSKNFSCQTYQVVVEALSRQDQLMEEEQKRSIVTYFIYPFLSRDDLSDPSCVSSTSGSSDWLAKNFGKFSAYASLEELLILNIHFSSVEVLDSLSPEQKAELILDPNTGALENETLVKEVMMGIISSSEEEQLYVFFEMFVSITKQEQINFIENAGVRDAILNMTLTALAPNFDTFQPSQYELWFQENLFVVLASFQPIWLLVIPGNLSCDSYKAILKGMDMSLAVLPVDLEQELRSSREMLSQTLPKGCTAPVPVGVVAALSSSDLVEVLACNLDSSMNYSRAIWNLFFKKFAAPLDEALSAYSNMSLTISLRDPDVLDAIAEVKVNMFSDAQLTDAVFITEWFQERLRPFLSSVSADFLSCLSSKNFSCQTYQVVVEALSRQDQLMEEEQKRSIVTYFIYPFLSRDDLSDPSCVSSTSGSSDWLAKNFGKFSAYASLEELLILNIHFSSVEVLDSLSPEQKAELILDPNTGALENETLVKEVMMGIISSSEEEQLYVFFEMFVSITKQVAALSSSDLVEVLACNLDSSMNYSRAIWNLFFKKFAAPLDEALSAYSNMSLTISLRDPDVLDAIAEVKVNMFSDAQLTDAVFITEWFQERLRPFLSSVSADFLSCLSSKNFSCQTYQVVVEALSRQDQLMEEEQKRSIVTYFIYPFLSRDDLSDPSCVSSTSGSSDWLAKNFGKFSAYASLEELLILNIHFSSVEVLDSLSPEQKAELILDPNTGALENETLVKEVMMGIISSSEEEQLYVFFEMFVSITKQVAALSSSDLVEVLACNLDSSMNYSRAIWNLFFKKFAAPLDEALSAYSNMSLTISLRDPDVLDAIAEVKVNMFSDAQLTDAVFITEWFQERLRPFLSSVSADFLSCLSSKNFSCQTYQVVVEALSRQDQLMEEEQKRSIVTYFIYPFLSRDDLSDPSCVSSTSGSSDWLAKNLGKFSAYASLEELLILNIHFSSVEVLDSLSPEQKAELILDPNTGALENETLVKEVMMGIISSSEEEQLYVFFEMFVSITKQEQINFIENAGVRDAILNMTLTALAPNFDTFQPSQYELWFQENLFVVLASFQPIWLLVIPGNLSCDSYKAILKGMDMSLAVLPVDLEQELRSSREMLSQTLPKGCTAPVPVGVVAALSSSDLVEVLACNLDSSMNYSRAIWNLFFKKFAAPLDEALSAYSNMSLTISLRDPDVLDAIAELKVNMFSDAQLTDAVFITEWFQERLRPFLSSVSADFLSCLSSKNFSCQTYQVVVEALSRQDQLMEEEQKRSIVTYFIYPFLSRDDLSDPSCVSSTSGSSDWLAKNFGKFSAYASLEELLILNIHFSSVEVLDSLSPEQKAELILDPNTGALENETLVKEVMMGIISSSEEEQLYVFFEMFVSITKQEQINFIENAGVRDAILNMTLTALAPNFDTFQPSQYELWFQENLFVVLASFQPIWLLVIPGNLSCDSYKAILKGMDMSLAVLPVDLEQELRSSREMLSQTLPKGCTAPVPVGVVAALFSSDLVEVLACNLDSSMNYSRAIWNLFFKKFAAPLDEALSAYSNMSLTISLRDPDVLDAIAEVKVNMFSDAQLTDAVFITEWFQERLRPFLSSVSADFLSCLSSKNFSCQTYQVVVEALSRQDQLMEEEQKRSIVTYFIYPFLSRDDLSDPSCVSSTSGSSDWLAKNFGKFSAYASLEELLILNIHFSSVEVLDSLSPEQKAELILDPNTGALENETLVKEVMMGIISSSEEEQLYVFFEMFVSITKQEQINFIENAGVRDAILNMTLTALAPNFDTFQPSQYELWFQENLFVVLASFQPIWLLVIPGNLSCDSYKAILKGMDMSLAVLPVDLEQELRSSREMLSQTLPKGCTAPVPVGVVAALFSSDLVEVLACNLDSSMNYSRAIWNLFFKKFAAPLDEALSAYSNMSLTISLRDPDVLDAIAEVKVNMFSDAQLTDAVFITEWFQERLRPFLSSVSADFLSCLSSKNFSCQTYQVVVEALSRQDQLMEEEQKRSIVTYFIYPFLSRDDLSDPSCVSSTSGSSDWLAKNFGKFSAYASLEELLILNIHFSSVEVLDLLSPEQKAELILDPNTGALENETLVKEVMMGIISSSEEEQLYVFFEMFVSITKQEQINFIENAGVRDAILNMTLTALAPNFDTFQPSQYELWFQENLFVVLASFQPIWLLVIPGNLSCDSYKAILKGMDMSLAVLPVDLEQELRSSREMLSQTLPKGCTAPVPVGVVAALSSSDLVEVLACNLDSSMNYSRAIWNLFFKKFAAPLDEALSAYSNMSLTISLRDPDVLDAIAEVKVNMFSDAQLTDAVFITEWFQERLRPFLSSVSADFLSCLSSKNFSCQTYQVVVEALSRQDQVMEEEQKRSIVTYFIYPFLSRDDLSDPSCVSSTSGSSDWLAKNFGKFSAYASLEELLILNIHFSSVEVLDSLSPEQKAELILDPNTGALENETLVKEVMMGIISSSEEEQLYVFFEMFVSITKQEQINFIENAGVRDAILNMTLTALAPNFDTFQPSQYELWFQENLFVVLASFQPIWLLVIPGNLSCDSYKAILKGMDMSLAVLPVDLEQELRSSREMLSQTLPKGCTAPVPVGVVAALFSSDLVEVLACNLDSSMNYSRAIWNLFFKKFAAPLDEALSAYSNMSLTISLRDPDVLDAIAEVKVNMFSDAQLTDAVFITEWFQERLRPFLSSVSADFLSCLSSKNFSCQTYQVVVEALSRQDQLMEEEQKRSIVTYFIYPFLSRDDLSDPSCVSSTSGSSDWLAKNFGKFSAYASLEELLILNIHFSSVEVLDLLSPEQKAELILDPNTGALENETLVKEVMMGIISSSEEEQLYVFFEMFVSITKQEQINFIENAGVRDAILNMTLTALAPNFDTFQPSQYELWFQENLFVVLASFQPIWLLVIPGNLSCDSYKAILKGMDMSLAVLPVDLEQELRSSREMLSQTLPKGCTAPVPVGVVAALSSSDLVEVLACNLDSSMNYSRAIWNLFFKKFAAPLDEALSAYSNMSLTISLRDPDVLDAIAEVKVNMFSDAQLTDAVFITEWFQERLRPFLSSVSADFLSCLSSKNFSCQTYQVVVEALSRQDQVMEEEQKRSIVTYFIYPFLSRDDLSDPSCVSSTSSSSDWLAKNFGKFSAYASLEELLILNIHFSSVEVLDSLSPEQKAELILDPNTGALENETLVKEVMMGIISSSEEEQLYVFFEMFVSITKQEQINFIENAGVRDAILNMTLTALAPNFDTFQPSQYELWFQENLFVVLASFQPIWLLVIPGNLSCDSYKAMWVTDSFSCTCIVFERVIGSDGWGTKMEKLNVFCLTV